MPRRMWTNSSARTYLSSFSTSASPPNMRCSSTFQPVTRLMAVLLRVSRSSDAAIFATSVGCHRPGCTAVMVLIRVVHELTAAANIQASRSGPRWRSANKMMSNPARSAAHSTSLASASGIDLERRQWRQCPCDGLLDLLRSGGYVGNRCVKAKLHRRLLAGRNRAWLLLCRSA